MPRTVFILQTKHEPTMGEVEVIQQALMNAADVQGPQPLSCVVVLPDAARNPGSLVVERFWNPATKRMRRTRP